jgi:glucose-6-phosphate isomerase, archaeal
MNKYIKESGLDFSLGENKLIYKKEDFSPAVDWIKDFEFAKYAYKDSSIASGNTYFGARYMEKTVDQELLKKYMYEYDVTVFQPGKVGEEYLKTVGHYHSHVPGLDVSYPEVYEVISGKVDYLLQSEPDSDGKVDVIWVVAEQGDKIVMPPNYGHVSLNPTDEIAIESNIQLRDLPKTSDYSIFKEKVGGALYRTESGLEENTNYDIKSIRIVRALEKADWGLTTNKPLYTSMIENPEKFQWLVRPQDFEFNLDNLFEDIEL